MRGGFNEEKGRMRKWYVVIGIGKIVSYFWTFEKIPSYIP
jgi:hypothetical protein